MRLKGPSWRVSLSALALLVFLSCYEVTETGAVVRTPDNPVSAQALIPRGPSAFGLAPVNTDADACTDFAAYACGAEASWGKVQPEAELLAWRTAAVWRFLDELAAGKHQDGRPGTALLKDLYTRCKDSHAREAGLDDLRSELKRIEQARTLSDLVTILSELHTSGSQIQPPDAMAATQRQFFLAYAQRTCGFGLLSPDGVAKLGDTHPPPRVRINATVANMAAFADAFGCRAPTPLAPRDRCALW